MYMCVRGIDFAAVFMIMQFTLFLFFVFCLQNSHF